MGFTKRSISLLIPAYRSANREEHRLRGENPWLPSPFPQSRARFCLSLFGLCILTYLPAFNNGFISDDFIMLDWVEQWRADFAYLFKIAPDVFRITSYFVLRIFTWAFGYEPTFLYAFAILVHFVNCVLLWKLIHLITGHSGKAALAAVLFAVFQNPQEAIMWLAAMADSLAGFFILITLLLWIKGRHIGSALAYLAALFSKESALVVLLLLPLIEIWTGRKLRFRLVYLHLLIPTLLFLAVFLVTLPTHHMVNLKLYALGWHAVPVLGNSLHRLMFPWLYLGVLPGVLMHRRYLPRDVGIGLAWATLALLPFIFLTYQNHVPSRQEYVPSMGLAFALAALLSVMSRTGLRQMFLAAFIVTNIGYIWLVKDPQFERRASPTSLLLKELRGHPPERVLVLDFPINSWMAKMTARLIEGWEPQMIEVNIPEESCPECPRFQWNRDTEHYDVIQPSSSTTDKNSNPIPSKL